MSHELDFITGTSETAMFSVRETPWHRLGKIIHEAPTLEEALQIGGLDWEVKKVPHKAIIEVGCTACGGTGDERHDWYGTRTCMDCGGSGVMQQLVTSKDAFSVVRMDRLEVIGTVGNQWQPLQNAEAFGVLRPLLDSGLARIETGGSLRRGKQVWMLVAFDTEEIIRRIEQNCSREELALAQEILAEVLPYGLFTDDKSGGAKARAKETAVRVVCANTFDMSMSLAEGTSVEVSHTGDVVANYQAAANLMLKGVAERWAALANARRVLQDTTLPSRAFDRLVLDPVVPIRHLELKVQRRDTSPQTKAALERAHEKRDRLQSYWYNGTGHDGAGSAWEAWQGMIEWADHDIEALTGLKAQNRISAERRVRSLHSGVLGELKGRVGRNLLAYATANADARERML